MRRRNRSMGLAVAAMLLVSCAKSAVDNKIETTTDSAAEAKAQSIVVTGSRVNAPASERDVLPMVAAPPAPPPPPPAPGMYVPQSWSPLADNVPAEDIGPFLETLARSYRAKAETLPTHRQFVAQMTGETMKEHQ